LTATEIATQVLTALRAVMTQTADTGQTDPSTVTAVSTSAPVAMWMFRFKTDTAQAAAPLFLKVSLWVRTLGTGSAAAGSPLLAVSVGTGTDGANNLTGMVFSWPARDASLITMTGAAVAFPGDDVLASEGDGWVLITIGHRNTGKYGNVLAVERSSDPSGTPTADGVAGIGGCSYGNNSYGFARVLAASRAGSIGTFKQIVNSPAVSFSPIDGLVPSVAGLFGYSGVTQQARTSDGRAIVAPLVLTAGDRTWNARTMVAAAANDLATGMTVGGHAYRTLDGNTSLIPLCIGNPTNWPGRGLPAIRWE
jgi:hypothetical protein